MKPFRASLTDPAGQAIAEVEGSIESEDEARGARKGVFVLAENESFMQDVLDEKPFRLELEDGSLVDLRVTSVSAGTKSGTSRVEFSSS
jgi:hypothetical protein